MLVTLILSFWSFIAYIKSLFISFLYMQDDFHAHFMLFCYLIQANV